MPDGYERSGDWPRAVLGGVKLEHVAGLEVELDRRETELETAHGELRRRNELERQVNELTSQLTDAQAAASRERAKRERREQEFAQAGEQSAQARRESAQARRELAQAREKSAQARQELAQARQESIQAEARVRQLLTALDESVGWLDRLPYVIWELTRLAAGESDPDGRNDRLGEAIHYVAGRHLLAEVRIAQNPERQASTHTEFSGNGRPVRTTTHLHRHTMTCDWKPSGDIADETVAMVQELCRAALLSLAGADEATAREGRGIVTQLADARAMNRHLALRERIGQPSARLSVRIDQSSAGKHRKLFGEIAWSASFADAGAALEEIAHRYGGQTYQVDPFTFSMVVDGDREQLALAEATERLSLCELGFDVRAGA